MSVKILGVDDNQIIRFVVAAALKPYDCTICQATNGEEGLAAALDEKPDIIILDISMPKMDGIEMLTKLREYQDFAQTPVILLTAWSGQERLVQAKNLAVRDYLVKPFKKTELIEKVGRIVSLELKSVTSGPLSPTAALLPPANTPATAGNSKNSEIVKDYGLSVPESVTRLARLVTSQEVDLAEIVRVINQDEALTTRLLNTNPPPNTDDSEIYTVEEALIRNGIGCVFLLTMGDLVKRALVKTFQDMVGINLVAGKPGKIPFPYGTHVMSEVEFSGRMLGKINLHFDRRSAINITCRILGVKTLKSGSDQQTNDVFREMTNIVVGNFLSNLADAGLHSRFSSPNITHSTAVRVSPVSGGITERFAYTSVEASVFLDISIDPWNEKSV